MNNYSRAIKYTDYITSVKELIVELGLCNEDNIVGVSDDEIYALEKKYSISFPPVTIAYLRQFGEQSRVRQTKYGYSIKLEDMDMANFLASMKIEWQNNQVVKELIEHKNYLVNHDQYDDYDGDEKHTPPIKDLMNTEDIVAYYYEGAERNFHFFDGSKENPEIFYFVGYDAILSDFFSFTNALRDALILYIRACAPDNYAEVRFDSIGKKKVLGQAPIIDFEKYPYLKDYITIFKKEILEITQILKIRKKFYKLNDEREEKEDRILTIHEFEIEFLSYLKSKGYEF